MNHFTCLLKHELRALFIAPSTYVTSIIFLLLMGFIYILILADFTLQPHNNLPTEYFFQLYWIPVFFIVPLLTMKSIAEERRMGTLETLMTTPVTATEIIFSKFLAAYLFYCLLWLLTLGFPLLVNLTIGSSAMTVRLLDPATLLGGYIFVAISGLLFISVGIFSSSLTRSQLVAGMLCFSILFIIILGVPAVKTQSIGWFEWLEGALEYFNNFKHLEDFSRGVIDTRHIVFYFSYTTLVLGISVLITESKV